MNYLNIEQRRQQADARIAEREYQARMRDQRRLDDMWHAAACIAGLTGVPYTLLHTDGHIIVNEHKVKV